MVEKTKFVMGEGKNRKEVSGYLARQAGKTQHIFVHLNTTNNKMEILEMWEGKHPVKETKGIWLTRNKRWNRVVNFHPWLIDDVLEAIRRAGSTEAEEKKVDKLMDKGMPV